MSGIDEITAFPAILAATKRAARGKRGRDEVARFWMDLEPECLVLSRRLRAPLDSAESWWPSPARVARIRDPKPRDITIVPFRDRVVHHALMAGIEPALERYAIHHSYACRRGRGPHAALARVQALTRRHTWAWVGDISAFFASIPHDRLLARLGRRAIESDVVDRIARVLGGPRPGSPPSTARGLPIGSLTSQHLANFYLGALDHFVTDASGVGAYVRYMDDFVLFGERSRLREMAREIERFVAAELGLTLNRRRSRIVHVREGVPFLGVRVFRKVLRPTSDRWRRFCRRHLRIEAAFAAGALSEDEVAASLSAQFAQMANYSTLRARRSHLARVGRDLGAGRDWLQPGDSRGLLERRPAERAGRESQQGRALQAQHQPGLSDRELSAQARGPLRRSGLVPGSDARRSRTSRLYPSADPTSLPRALRTSVRNAPNQPAPAAARFAWPPEHPGSREP